MLMPKHRVLSVKSGNPITIQDEDIGITWPAALVSCTDLEPDLPLLTSFLGWINHRPMAINCVDLLHTTFTYLRANWRT
jgi:hypothetical protein